MCLERHKHEHCHKEKKLTREGPKMYSSYFNGFGSKVLKEVILERFNVILENKLL